MLKLKVGDRVKVFGGVWDDSADRKSFYLRGEKATVSDVSNLNFDEVFVKFDNSIVCLDLSEVVVTVHPRQCAKLKDKKNHPKTELFVTYSANDIEHIAYDAKSLALITKNPVIKYVRVIE